MAKRFQNSLSRKKPTRNEKRVIVLVSEGENTERHYFKALEAKIDKTTTQLTYYGPCGEPSAIYRRAVEEREKLARDDNKGDEVWAIFDEDNHPHFKAAVTDCRRSGIMVGYSIPCFEVWLIWHEEDFGKQDDHHQVQKHFSGLCTDYDPKGSKTTNFRKLVEKWPVAAGHAKRHHQARTDEGDALGRPTSSLYLLMKSLFPKQK